jgi:hypothetical protein
MAAEAAKVQCFHADPPAVEAILVATTSAMPPQNSRHQASDKRHDLPSNSQTAMAMPIGPVTATLPIRLKYTHQILKFRSRVKPPRH